MIRKGFNEKGSLLKKSQLRIWALEIQLEAVRLRRRREVKTSLNLRFANIKAIQRTQREAVVAENNMADGEEKGVSDNEDRCIVAQINWANTLR